MNVGGGWFDPCFDGEIAADNDLFPVLSRSLAIERKGGVGISHEGTARTTGDALQVRRLAIARAVGSGGTRRLIESPVSLRPIRENRGAIRRRRRAGYVRIRQRGSDDTRQSSRTCEKSSSPFFETCCGWHGSAETPGWRSLLAANGSQVERPSLCGGGGAGNPNAY